MFERFEQFLAGRSGSTASYDFISRYGQRPVATAIEGKVVRQDNLKDGQGHAFEAFVLKYKKHIQHGVDNFNSSLKEALPPDLSTDDIRNFLSYPAVERKIAATMSKS